MRPVTANLMNAAALLLFGAWGYLGSSNPSATALIPVFFGVLLLICQRGLKEQNKTIVHIVFLLTALAFLALFLPLQGAMGKGQPWAVIRVMIMLATCALALWSFFKRLRVQKQD